MRTPDRYNATDWSFILGGGGSKIHGELSKQGGAHLLIKAVLGSEGVLLLKCGLIICFRARGCIVFICTALSSILCTECKHLRHNGKISLEPRQSQAGTTCRTLSA